MFQNRFWKGYIYRVIKYKKLGVSVMDCIMHSIQASTLVSTVFVPRILFLVAAITIVIKATRSVEFSVTELVIHPRRVQLISWTIKSQTLAIISTIMICHIALFIKATITSIISTSFIVQYSITITIPIPPKLP